MKLNNNYFLLRHGEALSNVKDIVSCWPEKFLNPLTDGGVAKIQNVAKDLKNKNIEIIFASPLLRTQQTAKIVAEASGLEVKTDKRLRELEFSIFNGGPAKKFMEYFKSKEERISKSVPGGENYSDVLKRVLDFFVEINKKYKGKNIFIVSHQAPLLLLLGEINGNSISESVDGIINAQGERKIITGQLVEINPK